MTAEASSEDLEVKGRLPVDKLRANKSKLKRNRRKVKRKHHSN